MEAIRALAQWLIDNIFNQPALLLGLVAFVGLILQRKPFGEIMMGSLKTAGGFLIMNTGVNTAVAVALKLAPILNKAFGVASEPYVGIGMTKFTEMYGAPVATAMFFGFLINLLLARLTPFKYIYLTGHLMWWMSYLIIAVITATSGLSGAPLIMLTAVLLGLYWTLQPAYTQKYAAKITGSNDIALGHTSALAALAAGWIGGFVGKPEDSAEKLEIPERWAFMKDLLVFSSLLNAAALLIASLAAGPAWVQKNVTGGQNFVVFALLQGITYGAGLTILLAGVRMFIAEIIPAFKGIADKLVPNAKPAVDGPVFWNFAPTSMLLGFFSMTITMFVLMIVLGVTKLWVLIPPMIVLFGTGGTVGVFGNATGGWKGAIIGGIVGALITAAGQMFLIPIIAKTVPDLVYFAGEADWNWWGGLLGAILRLLRL